MDSYITKLRDAQNLKKEKIMETPYFTPYESPYFWVGRKCRILLAAVFFDAELYVLILAVFVNSVWLIC